MRRPIPTRTSPAATPIATLASTASNDAGFVLPLAVAGALLLLLSSLSLSAAALQAQRLEAAQRARQKAEDQLASAAHQLAAALQGPYHCLLATPSAQWQAAALPAACGRDLDPAPLLRLRAGAAEVQLRRWQPDGSGSGGELWLQLGADGAQRHYGLHLLAPAQGLQELG